MIDAFQSGPGEIERNAYNAAFYELGFRWYWDSDTYQELSARSENSAERLRHYLETRQAHLLTAYDAEFLIGAIQQAMRKERAAAAATVSRHFDWAEALGAEVGA